MIPARSIVGMMLIGGAVLALSAAETPIEADRAAEKEHVARLLQDLDGNRRATRQRAERELLDLGPRILPLLPAADLLPTPGVRVAVARIRRVLERRGAQESVLPSRVTWKEPGTIAAALEQLSEQTGNGIDFKGVEESIRARPFDPDWSRTPFWTALDQVVADVGLRYEFNPRLAHIKLVTMDDDTNRKELGVAYSGPFRLAAQSCRLRPVFGNDDVRQLRVEINTACEPRLRPLFLKYAAGDIHAKSTVGRRFAPENPEAQYDLPLGEGGRNVRTTLDFVLPVEDAPDQIELTGKLEMQLAAGSERIRFVDLDQAAGVARRRGGVTVKLARVTRRPVAGREELTVRVQVTYDSGGPAFESHRTWVFHNAVFLESADGSLQIAPEADYDTTLQDDGVVAVEYRFRGFGGDIAGLSFVYVAPTLIVDVPIEFRLPALPVMAERQK